MNESSGYVEGLCWFTAQASNGSGACVEVAFLGEGSVAVRDSKDRDIQPFMVGGQVWFRFVQSAGAGTLCS
ncbi:MULTISPECIES: DUF397 domain-containing protein [unclassified Streptomyces]|uniref:DUF397 domain-containing protein n=1 Tax=unclassified Streptomyces TaxID=2593676 RepID=UPI000DBA873B|nr:MULTISPECIES: DUF397 domain-containing protein [unclassified Streptomyces]MYT73371.1 DUF397 domain-containing protein [Streptomyces sp. SID8367]RAJ70589.1 uncharacterized protein DUF397 [Streptomyces sp. PsTaAH-137]